MVEDKQHNPYAPGKARKETRIVVAMSGGVDSSVTAAYMHEQGYNVIGMTMQLYDHGAAIERKGACCAGVDIHDAAMVCSELNIPHYVLNYESRFKESVMDDFADSYMKGITPVPCVKCNQTVKFTDMLQAAQELDADALVTGHYIQKVMKNGQAELHKGRDDLKDQSYFLFATTPEQLDYIDFPLGGLTKDQTREMAVKYGLSVADKPDSQDICFVPNGDYAKVVEKLRPEAYDPGEIVHVNGQVLGEHKGIVGYTRGQRRGLGIGYSEPLYVIKVIPETRTVLVGSEQDLYQDSFVVQDVNWLREPLAEGEELHVSMRLRSAHKGAMGTVVKHGEHGLKITLDEPERAITPGQACVFYEDRRVLGGGWISLEGL